MCVLPGTVTSNKYALAGLWHASASKSNSIVPSTVKNIPHGCGVPATSTTSDMDALDRCATIAALLV